MIRRLLLVLVASFASASAFAAPNEVETVVSVLMRLCVAGGATASVRSDSQDQLNIRAGAQQFLIARGEAQGLVNGINSSMSALQADQADKARDCIRPYIVEIMALLLHPQNPRPEPIAPAAYVPPRSAAFLLAPAYRTNFADESIDFGVIPTIGLNAFVNQPTPSYINGGLVITTGELDAAMRSGPPFVLVDVLEKPHVSLPGAFHLPDAGLIDNFDDLDKQNWFIGKVLQMTRGSYDSPIVFYCGGVGCWLSYNAAKRAIFAGFRNVYWYRGGVAAWFSVPH